MSGVVTFAVEPAADVAVDGVVAAVEPGCVVGVVTAAVVPVAFELDIAAVELWPVMLASVVLSPVVLDMVAVEPSPADVEVCAFELVSVVVMFIGSVLTTELGVDERSADVETVICVADVSVGEVLFCAPVGAEEVPSVAVDGCIVDAVLPAPVADADVVTFTSGDEGLGVLAGVVVLWAVVAAEDGSIVTDVAVVASSAVLLPAAVLCVLTPLAVEDAELTTAHTRSEVGVGGSTCTVSPLHGSLTATHVRSDVAEAGSASNSSGGRGTGSEPSAVRHAGPYVLFWTGCVSGKKAQLEKQRPPYRKLPS